MIIVSEDDLAKMLLKSLKTIELDGFIKEKKLDPIFIRNLITCFRIKVTRPTGSYTIALKRVARLE